MCAHITARNSSRSLDGRSFNNKWVGSPWWPRPKHDSGKYYFHLFNEMFFPTVRAWNERIDAGTQGRREGLIRRMREKGHAQETRARQGTIDGVQCLLCWFLTPRAMPNEGGQQDTGTIGVAMVTARSMYTHLYRPQHSHIGTTGRHRRSV